MSKYSIDFLDIKFDNGNRTFFQLIANYLFQFKKTDRFRFQAAEKQKLRIESRISIVNNLFALNYIHYNHNNYENIMPLMKEFRNSQYKPQTTEKIRKDGNDDCINSFEYAISGRDFLIRIRNFLKTNKKTT